LPNRFHVGSTKTDKMWEKFNKGILTGTEKWQANDDNVVDEKAAAKFETDYDKTKA